ncbi:MAG: hypothetical protein RIQ60_1477 [Pseudomonadota bacterium]|jgi:hypothetical protein
MTLDSTLFDPLPGWVASAWLAVLLAHAALAKLADRALFLQHLGAYRLPEASLAPLQWTLPLAELAAAALLLLPAGRDIGAALAALLLLAYAGGMAWQLLQGRAQGGTLDCGCGGEPLPVSWVLVARNVLLAGLAGAVTADVAPRPLGLADFAVVAASLPLAALLYAAFNQLLRHQVGARMRRI